MDTQASSNPAPRHGENIDPWPVPIRGDKADTSFSLCGIYYSQIYTFLYALGR